MSNENRYKVFILLIIAIAIVIVIFLAYGEFIYIYINIIFTEEYGYLLSTIPITIALLIKIILDRSSIEGINIPRFIASLTTFLSSILMYVIGDIILDLYLELKTLSLVLLLWSFLILFIKVDNKAIGLLLLLSFLSIVPIPRILLDSVSAIFTRILVKIIMRVMNIDIIYYKGVEVLIVKDSSGIDRFFEIAPTCSGIISLLSVASITPAILYIAITSRASRLRKIVFIFMSLLASIAIIFIGNMLRIIGIILITRYIDYESALTFFHYTPSIIYVVIATIIPLYIVFRLPRKKAYPNNIIYVERYVSISISISISIALLIFMSIVFISIAPIISLQALQHHILYTLSLPRFLEKPSEVLFNTTYIHIVKDFPEPRLSITLGVPVVRSISLVYNNTLLLGYIEISDTPAKFHGWYVCLTVQGYRIDKSWTEFGNISINHIIASKSNHRYLLSYAIYRYQTEEGITFVRISLITPILNNYNDQLSITRRILSDIKPVKDEVSRAQYIFDISILVINMVFIIGILLIVLNMLGRIVYKRFISIRYKTSIKKKTLLM